MPRTEGAFNYTKEQVRFIRVNWKVMSDETLSKETGIPVTSVQRCRTRQGLSRHDFSIRENKTIAYICELFSAGYKIKEICGIVGKSSERVSGLITKSLFGTPHNENTETRTFQSKV